MNPRRQESELFGIERFPSEDQEDRKLDHRSAGDLMERLATRRKRSATNHYLIVIAGLIVVVALASPLLFRPITTALSYPNFQFSPKLWFRPKLPHSQPNVASRSTGARVLPELTSPTSNLHVHTPWSAFVAWFVGVDGFQREVPLPTVVIENTLDVGRCWEFDGSQGHITIALGRPVHISQLTIGHAAPTMSTKRIEQAPKNIALWGLVQSDDTSCDPGARGKRPVVAYSRDGRLPKGFQQSCWYNLGTFRFSVKSPASSMYQSYDVLQETDRLFTVILVDIESNWGAESTCIYHIGIHGTEEGGS
ncbi:hypothetical protein BDN71DRAFT_1514141 [Pleurotus eryngii]|uniref:SUN domain-containing protein n=1 Tax=Pleurotus eryngii TaxID=5323 RepID=A0A9P6D936_PLEER|nr:hypothetical protein BDN71DRAFT_1514141 [Pleurotus eryngii]